MSILNLPEPANWSGIRKITWWAKLCGIGGLTYFIVRGILSAVRGNYVTTILIVGFTILPVLLIVGLWLAKTGRVTTRTTSEATGFTVFPDKRFCLLMVAGLAAAAPSSLALGILVPRGMIDIPMSRGMQLFSPALFVAGAVIAFSGLASIARRGGVGHLKFTPAMVEYGDALRTRVFEWGDIVDVKDHSELKEGRRTSRPVVLHLRDGSEQIIGGLDIYVPGGVALYWLVRHYWKHPEDRPELVDSRAAERLRQGRFDLD